MKKIITFLLTLAMLFSINIVPVCASAQNNHIDFTDNYSDWAVVRGNGFGEAKGTLIYSNSAPNNYDDIILYTKSEFSSGEYIADVIVKKGDYISMLIKACEDKTNYSLRLDYKSGKISLLKRIDGGKEQLLKNAGYDFEYDRQYRIHITVNGSEMTVRINEKTVFSAKDNAISSGKIGFSLKNAVASIPAVYCYFDENAVYEAAAADDIYKNDKEAVRIYVAPDGNDANDGSEQAPLATMQKAKELARVLSENKTPVDVIFKEGEYVLSSGVTFSEVDSGKKGAWITYKAEEGAKVTFTGTKKLDVSKFETVTDEKILSRMCDAAKGKVMQLDLASQRVPKELLHWTKRADEYDAKQPIGVLTKPQIFLNDKIQQISRWPNSGQIPIYGVVDPGAAFSYSAPQNVKNGGTINYKESRPERWLEAKDVFLHGHFRNPWYYEEVKVKSIDTYNMTMTMDHWLSCPFTTDYLLCGWQAINLLEEIDIPGEWYIDQDNSLLYYYPPHELTSEDTFEIGVLSDDMITLNNTKYVKFEGLEFAKNSGIYGGRAYTRLDYIGENGIMLLGAENILIKNCTFRELAATCIHVEGKNILIDSCVMYNYGMDAVKVFDSGDYEQIVSGNTIIRNCHISGESMRYTGSNSSGGINLNGDGDVVGVLVEHNIIHNMPMPAIYYAGLAHTLQYNELYNVQNNASDGGAIYSGRSWGQMGTVSQYNYIHDVGIQEPIHIATGIYWDDQHSGNIAKYNIIKPDNMYDGHGFWLNGGSHNQIYANTIINAKYGIRAHSTTMNGEGTVMDDLLSKPFASKAYVQRFPSMLELYNEKNQNGSVKIRNDFSGNLTINAPNWYHEERYKNDETINGNVIMEEYDEGIFVDPDNQDYRVKKSVKEKYGIDSGILDEDFDINLIGIQTDYSFDEEKMKFDLLSPENGGSNIPPEGAEIAWEQSIFADRYEYKVAEDKEMTNIVAEGSTKNYSVVLPNLESDKTYYWTVKSVNDSRTLGCEHETESGVFSFTTGNVSKLDTAMLRVKIRQAKETLSTINEGELPGTYKPGTVKEFGEVIAETEKVLETEYGKNEIIDEAIDRINTARAALATKLNVGFAEPALSTETGWHATQETAAVTTSDREITIAAQGKTMNAVLTERLASSNVQCFDFMMERKETGGWYGIGIRQQDENQMLWSNSYYIVVKPDIIEFQGSGAIFATMPNNGKIEDNKWYSMKMAAINIADGVYYAVYIDDELLFEHIDKNGQIAPDGMITMYIPSGAAMHIRNSEKVETGLFDLSERLNALNNKTEEDAR